MAESYLQAPAQNRRRWLGLASLAALAALLLLLAGLPYERFLTLVSYGLGRGGEPQALALLRSHYLAPPVHMRLQLLLIGYAAVLAGLAATGLTAPALYRQWGLALRGALERLVQGPLQALRRLPRAERWAWGAATLGLAGLHSYHALTLPLTFDESYTFLNFIRQGPLVTMSYYPEPNNHIFFNLLSGLIAPHWPFAEAGLGLRFVAVLAGALLPGALYLLLRRYVGVGAAAGGAGVMAFSYPMLQYAALARGHGLMCLLAVAAAALLLRELSEHGRGRVTLWSGLCALGFYTVPNFLFPALAMGLLALIVNGANRDGAALRKWLGAGLSTALLTALLYAPVFVVTQLLYKTGGENITRLGQDYSWAEFAAVLPGFLAAHLQYMYPMPGNAPWLTLGLGVLAVGGAVGVFRRGRQGERPLAGWALLCWLAPLLPMLALQMVGFHRLLLIGQVALGLLVAMALAHMRQVRPPRAARFAPYVLGVFLGGLALQQLSALQQRFPQDYRQDIAAQRAYRYLRQQPPGPVLVDAAFHPQITAYEAFLARGYRTHLRFQPHQVAYDYVLLYRPQPMVPLQRVQARGFRIVHTTPQAWVLARQQAP